MSKVSAGAPTTRGTRPPRALDATDDDVTTLASLPPGTRFAPRTIMRASLITVVLGASLLTSACATKRETGAGIGAGAGGALGYAVGGTTGLVVGALAGGALGYTAGKRMDENDRRRAAYALERNQQTSWVNPDTGDQYRIEPLGTRYEQGRECREFRLTADVEGRPDEVHGTACRQPDGTWEAVSG
jgi:surface antigen